MHRHASQVVAHVIRNVGLQTGSRGIEEIFGCIGLVLNIHVVYQYEAVVQAL